MSIRGYDTWKLATPPEYECDEPDEDCTCSHYGLTRRDPYCPVHGKDPDQAYDEHRDRLMWEQPEDGGPDDEAPF